MSRPDIYTSVACILFVAGASFSAPQDNDDRAHTASSATVMSIMLTEIMPASDLLWGVDNPQSDAEWQELADAADAVIAAFESIRHGGSGPNGKQWATEKIWQEYIDASIGAANKAKKAGLQKNLDLMYEANDELYPPCESCHIDFNPGVDAEN